MRRGLFSRNGSRRLALGPAADDAAIIAHLDVLLNATRGQSPAAPRFGLPDFVDVAHTAGDELERAIERCVAEFEPRLEAVNVRRIRDDEGLQLRFEITARRTDSNRKLTVQTRMLSGGRFEIG